ncbi:M1 family metallopeptidase [Sphingosinicella sp. LHD-64]|uniref:M1 family metallopeptidase n=1 Tax=Sphingosinicella sp. LHD-64 TaxID=3072139 RepID=UPI002810140F|nr:M1 family metallopeptidase [Sphingosinicella sp. LHD-64]MDQ8758317.1 M1 family metallopeptidase [Sphingosinicella sp. LHD-64]
MRRLLSLAFAFAVAACTSGTGNDQNAAAEARGPREVAPILTGADARDTQTYARPEVARVTRVALDLDADFANRRMAGTATLDIQAAQGAHEIILDSRGLEIEAVTDAAGQPLQYALGANDAAKGQPLTIRFGEGAAPTQVRIRYRSAPDAEALQWLTPQQTAGGRHPYLFSQGQAILNRTWIPTQDSPGIRQTWEARITAPEPMKVVMSGERLTPEGEDAGNRRRAYRFRMDHPVAPYLIAIAAGDIAFRELGPRTGVWTEPAMLDRAAAELADTERMVEAAERLNGPYRWGRYDVIVLPPSFPYGGMENPTLTFLTPTFLAGDRSLNGLVAHELAHSWSGNLVTNATWPDRWLNEGFTSYFENRIMEALYGRQRAAQEEALSFAEIEKALVELGADAPGTRLRDDSGAESSGIVYDKGAAFLRTIERTVGRARFDAYLTSYFDRHAFQPMTTARFLSDLRANLIRGDAALEQRLQLDRWAYQPGLPDNVARPDPAAFAAVDRALAAYNAGGDVGAVPYSGWTTAERLRFLNGLPREMPAERLAALDRAFNLTASGNSETLFAWLQLALANRYPPAVPAVERFLAGQGRRKFVLPLFETLWGAEDWGRPIARRIYVRTRPSYHSVTSGAVDRLLGAQGRQAP